MCSSAGCNCDASACPLPGEPEFTSLVPMIKEEGEPSLIGTIWG